MLTGSALIWTYVAAAFCLFMEVNLIYAVWRDRNQVAAGKIWARTAGEMIESKVDVPQSHTEDDESDCTPTVRYCYSVDGKTYESDRIHFGGEPDTTRMLAEQIVAKYPAGAKVDVLYNPKHPKSAVLEGKSAIAPALYIMLYIFTVGSLVLVGHSIAGKVLTTPNGVPLFVYPILLIPIGLAAVLVGNFFTIRTERKTSAHWPTASGTITTSEVVEQVRTDENDKDQRDIFEYIAKIGYRYRVGGRDYFSSRRKCGWDSIYPTPDSAAERLASYPVGAAVPVYYNPADPQDAVLEPASGRGTLAPLFGAALFGGLGVGFMWFLIAVA